VPLQPLPYDETEGKRRRRRRRILKEEEEEEKEDRLPFHHLLLHCQHPSMHYNQL